MDCKNTINNKVSNGIKIFLALLMAFIFILSTFPVTTIAENTIIAYGKTVANNLNVRNGVGGKTLVQLKNNTIIQILQSLSDMSGNNWYLIYEPNNKISGYVVSSYISILPQEEVSKYIAANPQGSIPPKTQISTNTNSNTVAGYVETVVSAVNLRKTINGEVIGKISKGMKFAYTSKKTVGKYTWYRVVTTNNGFAYLRSDTIKEVATSTNVVIPGLTVSNTVPNTVPITTAPSTYGSITITTDKTNLRSQGQIHGTRIGRVSINTTYVLLSAPISNNGYTWYNIDANGLKGYVRGDMARFNNDATGLPSNNNAIPNTGNNNQNITVPTSSAYGSVTTIYASIPLRSSPNGIIIRQVDINQTLDVLSQPTVQDGYTWYNVTVNGITGYLRNDGIKYNPPTATNVTTVPTIPNTQNQPTQNTTTPTSYLITIVDKVNLRSTPQFGTKAPYNVPLGTTFPYTRAMNVNGKQWYKIAYNATDLWVLGTTVRVLGANETVNTTTNVQKPATPVTASQGTLVTSAKNVNLRQTAGGKTMLSIPKQGTELTYYEVTYTKNYTWYKVVYNNVTGYVRGDVVNIKTGNVANNPNQFTPSQPTTSTTIGGFPLYKPVQKSDWNTGLINNIWPRGKSFPVMDVRTGKSFMMYRWAGGLHIDGEPLTKEDTAVLCSIYGVSKASDIKSNKHWQRRPMWVTINGTTYCASLYGVPHNLAGNVIKDNNYDGQMCLHFTNSKLHGSKTIDAGHQQAIEEAFSKGQK